MDKSDLLSRKSTLEHKLKKGIKRIKFYEDILDEHPSAKPRNYRKSRLSFDDEDDDDPGMAN